MRKSKGNQFCFELAGNSSYRGFELSGFNYTPKLIILFHLNNLTMDY